jgi:hypothetical protein
MEDRRLLQHFCRRHAVHLLCDVESNPRFAGAQGQTGMQINLRTILLWVVPYVAIAAAILGWNGAFKESFLNENAKAVALTILTQFWCSMYMGSRFRAAYRNRSTDEPPTAPPHALDGVD